MDQVGNRLGDGRDRVATPGMADQHHLAVADAGRALHHVDDMGGALRLGDLGDRRDFGGEGLLVERALQERGGKPGAGAGAGQIHGEGGVTGLGEPDRHLVPGPGAVPGAVHQHEGRLRLAGGPGPGGRERIDAGAHGPGFEDIAAVHGGSLP